MPHSLKIAGLNSDSRFGATKRSLFPYFGTSRLPFEIHKTSWL